MHRQRREVHDSVTHCTSLDADRSDHFDVGQAHQNLLHAVHFQCPHTTLDTDGKYFGHPRPLLYQLLNAGVGDQQLVQPDTPLVTGAVTVVATGGAVQPEPAVIAVLVLPRFGQSARFGLVIGPPGGRMPQLLRVFGDKQAQFFRVRELGLFAIA